MSELARTLARLAEGARASCDQPLTELAAPAQYTALSETLGMDYRARMEATPAVASVFEGLAFDPQRVRSQAFYIAAGETPVAVISFVIAPRGWIEEQRYFKLAPDGVQLCGAAAAFGIAESPDYFIIPGWTKVADRYRTQFAHTGARFVGQVMAALGQAAPSNTWIEVIAQGKHEASRASALQDLQLGGVLPYDQFPFPVEDIGVCYPGSTASEKMALRLGLARMAGVGNASTLGSVFARRVGD